MNAAAPTSRASPNDRPHPQQIGRYVVEGLIGAGGFGDVYRALDPNLNRVVAIKVCRSTDEKVIREFEREAQRLAQLSHRNIVPVHDTGTWQGRPYLVMEYVGGGSLERWLLSRVPRPDYGQIARLIADIADALGFIHRQNFVHRDVKPRNILVQEVEEGLPIVYLSDFGLAASEHEQLREPPTILGTEAYMAPEQAAGKSHAVDGRTDIYSLGVVLFKLLTGRLPFQANSREEYRKLLRLSEQPPSPKDFVPEVPDELAGICRKCMAKRPSDRYTTAEDLAADLRRFADRFEAARVRGVGISAAVADTPRARWREALRRVRPGPLVLAIALSVTAALAFYWGEHYLASRLGGPTTTVIVDGDTMPCIVFSEPREADIHAIRVVGDTLMMESQGLAVVGLRPPAPASDFSVFECVIRQSRTSSGVAVLFEIAAVDSPTTRFTAFALFVNADFGPGLQRTVRLEEVSFRHDGRVVDRRVIAEEQVRTGQTLGSVTVELLFRDGRLFDIYIDRQAAPSLHDAILELRGRPLPRQIVAPLGFWVERCAARFTDITIDAARPDLIIRQRTDGSR
ncbi:MAG: serine/threonine protein kinase [Planctomycetota bacterium]|nr:MAG: serine/threonine protein kinase [Planctomycetota bacterium]